MLNLDLIKYLRNFWILDFFFMEHLFKFRGTIDFRGKKSLGNAAVFHMYSLFWLLLNTENLRS
jgi:hypothetical protein